MQNLLDIEAIKRAASLEKIIGQYVELRHENRHWRGLCPFHPDKNPSFYVTPDMGEFGFWKCFGCNAGGDVIDFVKLIEGKTFPEAARHVAELSGIPIIDPIPNASTSRQNGFHSSKPRVKPDPKEPGELVQRKLVETYPYVDESRNLLYEKLRYEPKDFDQRRRHSDDDGWVWGLRAGWYRQRLDGDWYSPKNPDPARDLELPAVRRVLFRLPEVMEANEVILCEGEKDVLTLERLGFVATTTDGGSKSPWLEEYTERLRGKRVLIFPDNDAPGESYGRKVESILRGVARETLYVPMPRGYKDVTEYVEAGHGLESVLALIETVTREREEADRRRRGLLSCVEVIQRYRGGLEAFVNPKKRPKGLLTGFHKLDDMTLGLRGGDLFVVAGRPTMGKTTWALNVACNVVSRKSGGGGVAVFSGEMSSESLLERAVCARAGIDSLQFRSGYASPEEISEFHRTATELAELPLFIDDYAPHTVEDIRRKLGLLMETQNVALVVIDYLQLMTSAKNVKNAANRVAEISAQTRSIKLMAREFNVPFMVLSQLSRACEIRPGDHRPQLSDLRESGSIEQDADLVAFVFRPEVYRPDNVELRHCNGSQSFPPMFSKYFPCTFSDSFRREGE